MQNKSSLFFGGIYMIPVMFGTFYPFAEKPTANPEPSAFVVHLANRIAGNCQYQPLPSGDYRKDC